MGFEIASATEIIFGVGNLEMLDPLVGELHNLLSYFLSYLPNIYLNLSDIHMIEEFL